MGLTTTTALRLAAGAAAVSLLLVGCGDDSDDSGNDASGTDVEASTPDGAVEVVREGTDPTGGDTVSREEAEQIALDAVGEGSVTWSGPEDDRGAAWEVEVTRPDGSEVDVLVAADGSVVNQIDKLPGDVERDYDAPAAGGTVISQGEAESAALAAVGEGNVTWVGREDERGAAWEVEVTRPDGSEVDVLVAADGSIVD